MLLYRMHFRTIVRPRAFGEPMQCCPLMMWDIVVATSPYQMSRTDVSWADKSSRWRFYQRAKQRFRSLVRYRLDVPSER